MGVSGTVGLIRKRGHWFREPFVLRDTPLVIDVTDGMYWLVKNHYVCDGWRYDMAGWSMTSLGAFFRTAFRRLTERKVRPIIVYNGARVNERLYGRLASKSNFLTNSCRAAMNRLARGNYTIQMPDICLSAIKEVVNEFGFETHQCCFESHQVLACLAEKHQCPVLTSHSDFVFTKVAKGFIWSEELPPIREWSSSPDDNIITHVYLHDQMLDHFKISQTHSKAVQVLYVFLRDDFSSVYYQSINEVLNLTRSRFALSTNTQDRMKTNRLLFIMEHWPAKFVSAEHALEIMKSFPGHSADLQRDFTGIWTSYSTNEPLSRKTRQFVMENFMPDAQLADELSDALTHRECSANFLMNLRQRTNYNRLVLEDFDHTYRSTFSIADRVRQYLNAQLDLHAQPRLFDRRHAVMDYRDLAHMTLPAGLPAATLSTERLFELFHFDQEELDRLAGELERHVQIDALAAKRLSVLLLLSRFGYRLAFRDSFDNSRGSRLDSLSRGASSTSRSNSTTSGAAQYLQPEFREKFVAALINSFVYHLSGQQGDIQRQEIPAEHRVMRKRLNELTELKGVALVTRHDAHNLPYKHLVEMMNATLHAYKELNSLYDFPGPNVLVHRQYDGVLIYQILSRWSNNLREMLLPLNESISEMMRI